MNPSRDKMLPPAMYVNFLRVAHQESEFFLSFGQGSQAQPAAAHLVASLVTSPVHAKAMARALAEAIERHEARFGEIALPQPPVRAPEPRRATPPRASRKGERGARTGARDTESGSS